MYSVAGKAQLRISIRPLGASEFTQKFAIDEVHIARATEFQTYDRLNGFNVKSVISLKIEDGMSLCPLENKMISQ